MQKVLKGFTIKGRTLKGIDVTNKDDPLYNDRCLKLKSSTGKILTLSEKRNMFFPNFTISCEMGGNSTCEYQGIDENNYSKCKCKGVQETKNKFMTVVMDSISSINFWIVLCVWNVLKFVRIKFI